MELKLEDFRYDLPEERIAKHPPSQRDKSKLLFYNKGEISHHEFKEISELIPKDTLLVFNDTKVIPARIILHKKSGARIEVFLLEPVYPSVHEEVMAAKEGCSWKCMIGNAKRWKIGSSLHLENPKLEATRVSENEVTFTWKEKIPFSDILTEIGKIPLPPYIDREVEKEDAERYQTVYSRVKGAVAAPTAGLHFTEKIIQTLNEKSIQTDYLTLHVSAGTFQPIKSENITEHPMHNEKVWISRANIEKLLAAKKVIAVGTTSMRTLESVYWYGAKLLQGNTAFHIKKEDPYRLTPPDRTSALKAILEKMNLEGLDRLGGETEIFIYPGYRFKICEGLITNYHLPGSTLILLVAAFIGENWKKVYREALSNNYKFLSYGDSSLLIP